MYTLKVGQVLRQKDDQYAEKITITAIGMEMCLYVGEKIRDEEAICKEYILNNYEPDYEKCAHALVIDPNTVLQPAQLKLSSNLYSSEQEAKYFCGFSFVAWPAIPDKNGFYTDPRAK